jgi:ABC-type bacteriocin/lantibiotic exporter with double-glycine peptidase domain
MYCSAARHPCNLRVCAACSSFCANNNASVCAIGVQRCMTLSVTFATCSLCHSYTIFLVSDTPKLRSSPPHSLCLCLHTLLLQVGALTHVRTMLAFYMGVRASRRLHGEMLKRVLHAPVAFFDTTPVGRLVQVSYTILHTVYTVLLHACTHTACMEALYIVYCRSMLPCYAMFVYIVALVMWRCLQCVYCAVSAASTCCSALQHYTVQGFTCTLDFTDVACLL